MYTYKTMEIITGITPISGEYIGYEVSLDDGRSILLKIRDGIQCCEDYGCEITASSYNCIGHELGFAYCWGVDVDEERTEKHLKITTTGGDIKIMCYNEQNGYYPHEVVVQFSWGEIYEQCREAPCDADCASCKEVDEILDSF